MQLARLAASLASLATCAALAQTAAYAQAPEVSITRFDCGTPITNDVNQRFSDTYSLAGLKVEFVFSCYLIKHGNEYMMWDTGFGPGGERSPKLTLPEQLAKVGVKPEQIKFVGISHYHGDHIGGAQFLTNATLLIGKGDWDVISGPTTPPGQNFTTLKHWTSGGGKVEPVPGDKDVFGDGTVMMLYTPGHTPGHHSLMVKLAKMGPVVLSGDAAHFHENYDSDGVPTFNFDRAETVASIERLKKLVASQKATFVIQHDARDVSKLPAAPDSAS
jgi:glyoxylase-like metal-dependent hydrolase (beta-lactamase superfamily II)